MNNFRFIITLKFSRPVSSIENNFTENFFCFSSSAQRLMGLQFLLFHKHSQLTHLFVSGFPDFLTRGCPNIHNILKRGDSIGSLMQWFPIVFSILCLWFDSSSALKMGFQSKGQEGALSYYPLICPTWRMWALGKWGSPHSWRCLLPLPLYCLAACLYNIYCIYI